MDDILDVLNNKDNWCCLTKVSPLKEQDSNIKSVYMGIPHKANKLLNASGIFNNEIEIIVDIVVLKKKTPPLKKMNTGSWEMTQSLRHEVRIRIEATQKYIINPPINKIYDIYRTVIHELIHALSFEVKYEGSTDCRRQYELDSKLYEGIYRNNNIIMKKYINIDNELSALLGEIIFDIDNNKINENISDRAMCLFLCKNSWAYRERSRVLSSLSRRWILKEIRDYYKSYKILGERKIVNNDLSILRK